MATSFISVYGVVASRSQGSITFPRRVSAICQRPGYISKLVLGMIIQVILRRTTLSEIIAQYCTVTIGIVLAYFPNSWLNYKCVLFFLDISSNRLSTLLLAVLVRSLRVLSVDDICEFMSPS